MARPLAREDDYVLVIFMVWLGTVDQKGEKLVYRPKPQIALE